MGESQRAYRCCIKEDSNDDSDECNGSDEDVDEDGSQRPFILCGCTSNMFEDPCKCLHTGCLELALGCGLKIPRPLCVAPEKFSRCCKKIAGKATKTTHSAEEDTKDVTSTATTASALSTSQVATMTTPITGNQTKGLLEGPSNGDSPPSAASAVIAGAVVGGLMAIVLLALLIYFWSQRRKKMRKASDKTSSMEHVETSDCGGQGAVGYQSENGVLTNGEYEEINEDSLAKEKVEDNEYSRLDKTKTDQNAYDRLHSMPKEGKSDGCSSTLNPTPQYFVLEEDTKVDETHPVDETVAPYFVLEHENEEGGGGGGNKAPNYFVLEAQNQDPGEQSDIKSSEYFVLENEVDGGGAPTYFVLEKDMPQVN